MKDFEKLEPLGRVLLVKIMDRKQEGLIVIPDNVTDRESGVEAVVIRKGPRVQEDVNPGDKVYLRINPYEYSQSRIKPLDDDRVDKALFFLAKEEAILAVLD
jgi:hypothetical protein